MIIYQNLVNHVIQNALLVLEAPIKIAIHVQEGIHSVSMLAQLAIPMDSSQFKEDAAKFFR